MQVFFFGVGGGGKVEFSVAFLELSSVHIHGTTYSAKKKWYLLDIRSKLVEKAFQDLESPDYSLVFAVLEQIDAFKNLVISGIRRMASVLAVLPLSGRKLRGDHFKSTSFIDFGVG